MLSSRPLLDLRQDAPTTKALGDREADLVAALGQRQDELVEESDSAEEAVVARNV